MCNNKTVKISPSNDVKWLIWKLLLVMLTCSFVRAVNFDQIFRSKENKRLECDVINERNFIQMDCSNRHQLFEVPQNIENLKVLNMSHNYIGKITKESFEQYSDTLTILDMSYMAKWTKTKDWIFTADSLSVLHRLEYLDLSASCHKIDFHLPSSIKILKIENCSTQINVTLLNDLEEFYAAGNAWTYCPDFHESAPLRYIDLRRNELLHFEIEKIAPFCYLNVLRLNKYIPDEKYPKSIHNMTTYCACAALESWLINTEVEHEPLNCTVSADTEALCDENFTKSAFEKREHCLTKMVHEDAAVMKSNWLLLILFGVVVFLLLVIPFVASMMTTYIKNVIQQNNESKDEKLEEEELQEEEMDEDGEDT